MVIFHTDKRLENTWLGNCYHADRGSAPAGRACSLCSAPIARAREIVSVYALKAAAIRVARFDSRQRHMWRFVHRKAVSRMLFLIMARNMNYA